MKEIKKILVVSRMTKLCQEALRQGISLAKRYEAELYVIHVVHNPFGLEGWNLPGISLKEEYQKILKGAKEDLDEIIRQERVAGVEINELIKEGDPTKEILKTISEEKIDLLVLQAHKEWRLEHFLFGRSNEELIRRMPCSLWLVKNEPQPVDWE